MAEEKPITYAEAMTLALAQVNGPIAVDEFIARVLTIRPSKAKKAATSLRNALRWEHAGRTVAFLDRKTIVPLRIAMRGVRFRIPVTRQEAIRGVLFIDPGFYHFLRQGTAHEDVQLLDAAGHPLAVRVVVVKQTLEGWSGPFTYEADAFDLGDWFRAQRIRRDDSILVTIEDWQEGHFRLEHEPARHRRQWEIERKNQELAELVFDILEAEYDEQVFAQQAIPTAYIRLSDPQGYPGDHWIEVIARDPRMTSDGLDIRYSDFRSLLEVIAFGEEGAGLAQEPPTPAQARQVYRFKAALHYRPGLWRRIEIQGGQTLADFDSILRNAFEHDTVDHLSGFWKRTRRGTGKRFREVDLGDIHPYGGGSGAERHLAAIGLKPGDQLKYVYDFGDWIKHRIILEEIVEPEADAEYPRIAGRNKPRYRYCESCEAKGRKTIATWICFDCSNEQEHNVLVCEDCLMPEHEEHWADEILY
jgi:hypothetical protein